MNEKGKTSRYLELDSLRGIAALMVVFFHFTMGRPEADLGFKLGTTGVDLFFIISGFVIFMSINKVTNSTDFIINRISRLYPTYWFVVTFTFLLIMSPSFYKNEHIDKMSLIKYYLGNMTMFQFYLKIPNLDEPYWTLIVEMLFYIGVLSIFRFKLLKRLNIIGIFLTITIIISNCFFNGNAIVKWFFYWIPFFGFVPLFLAGIIFYKIYNSTEKQLENYSIIVLCLISQILLFKHVGRSVGFINQLEYSAMLILYFTLFTLFVNKKLKFIISKGTLFLGKISYSLYLIHQYISFSLIHKFNIKLHINFWIVSLFITLPIIILIASFITNYIEIPMGRLIKRKLLVLSLRKESLTY